MTILVHWKELSSNPHLENLKAQSLKGRGTSSLRFVARVCARLPVHNSKSDSRSQEVQIRQSPTGVIRLIRCPSLQKTARMGHPPSGASEEVSGGWASPPVRGVDAPRR